MTQRFKNRGNGGFSLVETLTVVAILVILLGISAVAAFRYRDYLKITELDNAARDIYMAAANRAVLLDSSGQLEGLVSASALAEGEAASDSWLAKDALTAKGLLTAEAVDRALLAGDFRVIYDPDSFAVTDVFYAESAITKSQAEAMAIAGDRDKRMKEEPMLGYYGGEQAARKPYTPLPSPEVMVEVENGDVLKVHVTFTVPASAKDEVGGNWEYDANQTRTVKLTYRDSANKEWSATLMDTEKPGDVVRNWSVKSPSQDPGKGSSVTYTWMLDRLDREDAADGAKDNYHFWQLFSKNRDLAPVCGGDFTVTADFTLRDKDGDRRPTSASGSDTGNSLFAERSGGSAVQIENLRHLQNLDTDTSNAGGKTRAVQMADIACRGTETLSAMDPYGLYQFAPINNSELESFDGGQHEITDLLVTAASAAGKPGAGLFAKTADGKIVNGKASGMTFTGVRLIEADVSAGDAPAAGVLVGAAGSDTAFRDVRVVNGKAVCPNGPAGGVAGTVAAGENSFVDCWVYWEPEEGQPNLRSLLGSDQENDSYKFDEIICGTSAGGLAGMLSGAGKTTITKSLAATLVSGTNAGGLVGEAGQETAVNTSYADCYLKGKDCAAGLIGKCSKGAGTQASFELKNAYAAGFIDMKGMTSGFVGGLVNISQGTVKGDSVYTAVAYLNQTDKVTMTPSLPDNGKELVKNCYYLSPSAGAAGAVTYDDMSTQGVFDKKMNDGKENGAFAFKKDRNDTHPYNLQEKQTLDPPYKFPGLQDLPHYGDWRAYFKEPSLVYYEKDSKGKVGFSGGNARELIGKLDEGITVKSDGYAVARLRSDLDKKVDQEDGTSKWENEVDSFTISYTARVTTLVTEKQADGTTVEKVKEVFRYPAEGDAPEMTYRTEDLTIATWTRKEAGKDVTYEYYLVPLPEKLVTGVQTCKEFYQYLHFEIKEERNGKVETASGEYFYNPHFAETVRPYVPEKEGASLVNWASPPSDALDKIHGYITETLAPETSTISVSVRTPRHFFHLSQYENYYNNARLSFQQGLVLDGFEGIYEGHKDLLKYGDRHFQLQTPIGTQDKPFLGTYNGDYLEIRRLAFELPANDKNRVCAGLFGSSNGTLENIFYTLDPKSGKPENEKPEEEKPEGGETESKPRRITFLSSEKETYLGALTGLNGLNGKIRNCTVDNVNLTTQAFSTTIYIGGLCGANNGKIQNSAAESARLHVEASNYARAYVGGLTGRNADQISASYAIGRLAAEASQENAPAVLAGFVGLNSGSVSNSYAAMHLDTDGVKASAWGFCGQSSGGRQSGTYYLNNGNFSYRKIDFLANYEECEGGAALPISYAELTGRQRDGKPAAPVVTGMSWVGDENGFPYPSGVKARNPKDGKLVPGQNDGDWPKPLELGSMGVYYWEELRVPGKKPSYHVSLLAVDPGKSSKDAKTISKISTLSTAHDEGGEVTRFGYGIYNRKGSTISLPEEGGKPVTDYPLLYAMGEGNIGETFSQDTYKALEDMKKPGGGNEYDKQVDDALAKLMSYELDKEQNAEFEFHSFHSYGQNKSLSGGDIGGLYPNSTPDLPNGTLTLYQEGTYPQENKQYEITVDFLLNPLFADALAVEKPAGWGAEKNVPVFTMDREKRSYQGDVPGGSEEHPYGVRSIDQLQFINWNSKKRNTSTVLGASAQGSTVDVIANFPYLSSSDTTGKYFWKQSYDILGKKEQVLEEGGWQLVSKTYTPIAEYYDWTGGDQGNLTGWFGGTYDGGTYLIEDVNITGQKSSCAGLFGVVYDGSLENIVLYSSDGKGVITTKAGKTGSQTESRWFAMGGLAGVAGTSNPKDNAIKNCSIAGYTILAEVYTYAGNAWGGSNIGGLVGSSHMNFSGCSAVTDIVVQNAVENDNMRVGGLAGICLGTVSNCYAGGSITLDSDTVKLKRDVRGIYVGGLVGGSYMKPLKINNSTEQTIGFITDADGLTSNTLSNCYSYVRLPAYVADKSDETKKEYFKIKGMFVIGGAGEIEPSGSGSQNHGTCKLENCYYLGNESLSLVTAETILNAGIKTDLKNRGNLQDSDRTRGEEFSTADKFWEIAGTNHIYNFRNIETGQTENISKNLYYRENIRPEKGVGLFRYTGRSDDKGHWIYKFYGWIVDASDSTWTYTTDPDYFTTDAAVTNLTYEQLAGLQMGIPGKDPYQNILQLLNAGKDQGEDAFFERVSTKTEDGVSVPGKYSYPTQIRPELRDRDYPFPTILTKDSGKYRVHYGDWPLKGFRRQTFFNEEKKFSLLGGSPIEIDLFVNGTDAHQEYLVLTDGVTAGGEWDQSRKAWGSVKEAKDPDSVETIADFTVSAQLDTSSAGSTQVPNISDEEIGKAYYLLTVTPKRDGTDTLYLTYKREGVDYTLPVVVHITSLAELRPSRLFMFPDDMVDVAVKATDKANHPLKLEGGKLTLKGDSPNCGDSGFLTGVNLVKEGSEDYTVLPTVRFATAVPVDAPELEKKLILGANIDFAYTVPDPAHPDDRDKDRNYGGGTGGDVRIEIIQPWKVRTDDGLLADREDFTVFSNAPDGKVVCTVSIPKSYAVEDGGTLRFALNGEPEAIPMPNAPEKVECTESEAMIVLTLTYPVTDPASIPNVTELTIPLVMTSGAEDGGLIEGAQRHTLTLGVKKPVEPGTVSEPPAVLDALPPDEEEEEKSVRRRRAGERASEP